MEVTSKTNENQVTRRIIKKQLKTIENNQNFISNLSEHVIVYKFLHIIVFKNFSMYMVSKKY